LYKSHILDRLLSLNNDDNLKMLKKTDGKKANHIYGIPKLDDANWAGTDKSHQCVLILTEGLSAKTTAISGLSELGRNRYGIYPLKGKILNVDGVSIDKITNNQEINDFKKIMGLESGREYNTLQDLKSLRYGKIMIFTDMDSDGHHIKGLIFNLLYRLWPSLLKNFDFAFTILNTNCKS
jgi:DNA topoisomerase-2